MEPKDQLVLFGPPGVGKSTVSKLLVGHGYYHFDGDTYSLPEGIALNKQGKPMTQELRDRDYAHIIQSFVQKSREHKKIVFDYHFMFDRYRLDLRRLVQDLRWVYFAAPFELIEGRLNRANHVLSNFDFAKEVFLKFEEPSFEVKKIDATLPVEQVLRQVLAF